MHLNLRKEIYYPNLTEVLGKNRNFCLHFPPLNKFLSVCECQSLVLSQNLKPPPPLSSNILLGQNFTLKVSPNDSNSTTVHRSYPITCQDRFKYLFMFDRYTQIFTESLKKAN